MKKRRKASKNQHKKVHSRRAEAANMSPDAGRRRFLRLARNVGVGAIVVAGTGYVFAQNFANTMHEHDLGRVDNGTPTVVQIHDPQCALCLSLQTETRKAIEMLGDRDLDYVIANIRSDKGLRFANRYGVQHVTLLLFDRNGDLQSVLQGQQGSYQLKAAFEDLLNG